MISASMPMENLSVLAWRFKSLMMLKSSLGFLTTAEMLKNGASGRITPCIKTLSRSEKLQFGQTFLFYSRISEKTLAFMGTYNLHGLWGMIKQRGVSV